MAGYDLSMFAGTRIPDIAGAQAHSMTLQALSRRNKALEQEDAYKQQEHEAKQIAAQGLSMVQQGAPWEQVVQQVAKVNPQAAQHMLSVRKADEGDRAKLDYTRSQTAENDAKVKTSDQARQLKGLGMIASVAAEERRRGADHLSLSRVQAMGRQLGVDLPELPEGTDVNAYLATLESSALDVKDRMQNETTMRGQDMTRESSREGHGVTARGQDMSAATAQRGQNMTDARSRELAALTREQQGRPTIQTDADGNMFAVDPRSATGRPVLGNDGQPLNKGGKPLTEAQGNATAFGIRMKDASATIADLESKGLVDPAGVLVASAGNKGPLGVAENYVAGKMNPQAQVYKQAMRNWVTANLRKESGAAIPDPELESEFIKWFPQMGDSDELKASKAASRVVAERAMSAQAGSVGSRKIADDPGSQRSAPAGKTFANMPPAKDYPGRRVQDDQGNTYQSISGKWVRE